MAGAGAKPSPGPLLPIPVGRRSALRCREVWGAAAGGAAGSRGRRRGQGQLRRRSRRGRRGCRCGQRSCGRAVMAVGGGRNLNSAAGARAPVPYSAPSGWSRGGDCVVVAVLIVTMMRWHCSVPSAAATPAAIH